ncbi:MAG TPA: hypothetical protein DCY12_02075 [Candidatus Atribacteria bacterium]|nr:hypothetical protein [Candidatus Atribacteria bacterium]
MIIHFTDYFQIDQQTFDNCGAFNVSLINDLPLFIDPFLLFSSNKPEYQQLHNEMISYLKFLRDKSIQKGIRSGLLKRWFTFSEISQTWLGFSAKGNKGRGLGLNFAIALNNNLNNVFTNFGNEQITKGSHLEKLCLIKEGIGKDFISDFTTNLIKKYLLDFTQNFSQNHIDKRFLKKFKVDKVKFNYFNEHWESELFILPNINNEYLILTPKDLLTKDDIWINKYDMVNNYDQILNSIPNEQLRDQLNNYLLKILPLEPTESERRIAIKQTVIKFPQFIEYYILNKENHGQMARSMSEEKVYQTQELFVIKVRELINTLKNQTDFYNLHDRSYDESIKRLLFLKDVIENKGGWKYLYQDNKPISKESDIQILYRLTWYATELDVSREVNDGRGPADFKISSGSIDKTIVEFKLASNPQLKRNLQNQVEIYKKASDAKYGIKAIFYFSQEEKSRVLDILDELNIDQDANIVLIDARSDNKPSASKA